MNATHRQTSHNETTHRCPGGSSRGPLVFQPHRFLLAALCRSYVTPIPNARRPGVNPLCFKGCHKLSSRRLKKKKLTIAKNGERWCVTVKCVFGGTWPTLSPFAAANYFSAVRVCLPAVPRDGSSLSSCAAQPPDPLLARLVTPCPPRHQWCTVQPRWQRRSWAAHAQQWSGPSSCRVCAMFRGRRSAALSARP